MKDKLKTFLENSPKSRERKHKDSALVYFILKNYNNECMPMTSKMLVDFCQDFNSADRYWRMILQENPKLQGRDYEDRTILSQKWQINEGKYEPNYYKDVQVKLL